MCAVRASWSAVKPAPRSGSRRDGSTHSAAGEIGNSTTTCLIEGAPSRQTIARRRCFGCRTTGEGQAMEVIVRSDADAAATLVARLIADRVRAKPDLGAGPGDRAYRWSASMTGSLSWTWISRVAARSTSTNTSACLRRMNTPIATTWMSACSAGSTSRASTPTCRTAWRPTSAPKRRTTSG